MTVISRWPCLTRKRRKRSCTNLASRSVTAVGVRADRSFSFAIPTATQLNYADYKSQITDPDLGDPSMMNRRSFLSLSASAAALPALQFNTLGSNSVWPSLTQQNRKLNRLRLSVTWGMMSRLPIPDALAKLNDLGY